MDWENIIVVVISGLVGGGLVSGIATFVRSRAAAQKDIGSAWEQLLKPLREEVERLHTKVDQQDEKINDLEDWASRLVKQVCDFGGKPVPFFQHNRRKVNAES